MKKLISLILSICMVVTGLPMVVYAANSTPEISLDEFTRQLQDMQTEYDDYYASEIIIENDCEFYRIDGEEFPISDKDDILASVTKSDIEIPVSAIADYCDIPEISAFSIEENSSNATIDKETAEVLGFEVDIENDTAVLTQPYQTKRLIVKSKYDINPLDSVAIVEGYNDLHIVQFDNKESAKQAQEYYEKQRLIEYAEPDLVVSTMDIDYIDTNSVFANSISSYGSHLSWGSDSIAVDDYIDTLSEIDSLPEIIVGIIDTGIDLDHEFLKDRIIETNYNTSDSGIQNSEEDDEGHGTHVAGIVADNTTDNIKIKSYKALNSSGSGSISNIVTSVNYAVNDGVNVINMSLGAKGESASMENAVNNATKAGVVVCVAAGNSGANASKYTPASIENCITVAAIDEYDREPYWTNWGEETVNIVAPGVSIYSTYNDGSYKTLSGTSMACPFVTASTALLLSKNSSYSRDEVCDLLVENGREWTKLTNHGLAGIPALYIGNVEPLLTPRTAQPYFSIASGRYRDSITVEIICDDKDAKIYYTTDGTRATDTNGTLYTEPIVIDKVTTLSASAYAPDKLKSIQMSARYYITYLDDESNFEIDSNGIIVKYNGSNNYLTVPDTIKGIGVTGIGNRAFFSSDMTMIKLPDCLTSIGDYAFYGCRKLYSVDANNINTVGNFSFYLCQKLELFDFSSVESIGNHAFMSCKSLTSINGDNIKRLGNYTFNLNDTIIYVYIPNCIEVGEFAFANNTALETIVMDKLEKIGVRAFDHCKRLSEIHLPNLKSIGNRAFYHCQSLSSIDIPNFDGTIPNYCFYNSPIENLYLPKVTAIGDYVFSSNNSLKIVYSPNLTTIGTNCFDGDTNLEIVFAPKLTRLNSILPNSNCTLYLSDEFEKGINNTSYAYKIIAPINSYAEQWAKENSHIFIPSDSRNESIENPLNVTDLGRSICTSVAGLRFGFTWDNIDEIENLASSIEYGFVYSQKGIKDLSLDTVDGVNVKTITAPNRIDHGDTTSFNLIISNIPKNYQDREITARAYVCIDGMYFYSNTLKGSFSEVANLVLNDDEIDINTKNAIEKLLEMGRGQ